MPYLVLGLGETALILAIMRWAFAVPIQGSQVFLFGIMAICGHLVSLIWNFLWLRDSLTELFPY